MLRNFHGLLPGSGRFGTPNLDRMAKHGAIFQMLSWHSYATQSGFLFSPVNMHNTPSHRGIIPALSRSAQKVFSRDFAKMATKLSFFGSAYGDEDDKHSLDSILVEFFEGREYTTIPTFNIKWAASQAAGRKVYFRSTNRLCSGMARSQQKDKPFFLYLSHKRFMRIHSCWRPSRPSWQTQSWRLRA